MSKLQLHSELLYFFGCGASIMRKYGKVSYAKTRYRKRYGIAFDKVSNLKEFCRSRIRITEYVESDNYDVIQVGDYSIL